MKTIHINMKFSRHQAADKKESNRETVSATEQEIDCYNFFPDSSF